MTKQIQQTLHNNSERRLETKKIHKKETPTVNSAVGVSFLLKYTKTLKEKINTRKHNIIYNILYVLSSTVT